MYMFFCKCLLEKQGGFLAWSFWWDGKPSSSSPSWRGWTQCRLYVQEHKYNTGSMHKNTKTTSSIHIYVRHSVPHWEYVLFCVFSRSRTHIELSCYSCNYQIQFLSNQNITLVQNQKAERPLKEFSPCFLDSIVLAWTRPVPPKSPRQSANPPSWCNFKLNVKSCSLTIGIITFVPLGMVKSVPGTA